MASIPTEQVPHLVLIPLMSPGHIIPMIDIAKLLAKRGSVTVSIVVTPLDATRFSSVIDRAVGSGLQIQVLQIRFPCEEAGLPPGCESADRLPSYDLMPNFFAAIYLLQNPLEEMLQATSPRPSCVISDKNIPWTVETCNKLQVPRIVFDGMSCFTRVVSHHLFLSRVYEAVPPTEPFLVPGLPDEIELTRLQLPGFFNNPRRSDADYPEHVRQTESQAYGLVVNSFEELENRYVDEFRNLGGGKVWCIGPLSLCGDDELELSQRGNHEASVDSDHCFEWLDGKNPGSVVYACLGSLASLPLAQFVELALGLEASDHSFILVIKGGPAKPDCDDDDEIEKWIIEDGIEERIKERGLFIRGWAPQVMILSHSSIGGFLTHCGWNSTLEGISAGLPMITWPMFADQFLNEKLVVQILGTGVSVGARCVIHFNEAENKVMRDGIKEAVQRVMDDEREEGRERRTRARELGTMAKRAVQQGGSSCLNITMLIQDIEELMRN